MPLLDLANGYYTLPPGKLANIVTCLEMGAVAGMEPAPLPVGFHLRRMGPEDAEAYRAIFRRVGQDFLWFSRLIMTQEALRTSLARSEVEAFVLLSGTDPVGLFELDFSRPGVCELALFGLVPDAVGHGLGRMMMQQVQQRAFQKPINRLWVHTCNTDHPRALAFYQTAGFKIYQLMIEVHDDPRLLGYLPLDAAPQVPLIKP